MLDAMFFNESVNLPQKLPVNTCEYKPCMNGGECVRNERNDSLCRCTEFWTGIFCHLTLCNRKPCGNHGICELNTDSSDRYVCHCDSEYDKKHKMQIIF
ncbi:unnamed protein product [Medioppia subpectinata]|uniref:EGF-like domain-containing protein n=1 Tax=Medioppia subpectinata TaxID=1979941 RepID=A0A7R9LJU1_9ACAR|nr:unnamed protein product [Medioppia subpectinata]CAG2118874.1 unnamed protein product [Medioppia subpectinata]